MSQEVVAKSDHMLGSWFQRNFKSPENSTALSSSQSSSSLSSQLCVVVGYGLVMLCDEAR